MQERHRNRELYFKELATTSEKYFIPYIQRFHTINNSTNILEIGCGDGGNLLPLSLMGCKTLGVDMAECRIDDAKKFFKEFEAKGEFIASDIFKLKDLEHKFDIIICHDVFEHISEKQQFLLNLERYLASGGIVFMSFPAWQMPFGGHQQICQSRIMSHLPFYHILPRCIYKGMLKIAGENEFCINELMSIKSTRTPIELFEKLVSKSKLEISDRRLYFINPHYEVKFGLKPRVLNKMLSSIPYLRNYFSTSCFYILSVKK